MKRLVSLLLFFIFFLSLSACAQNNSTEDSKAATKVPMTGCMRADSHFLSLEEIAYLKSLLDKDDAVALEAYKSQVEEDCRPYISRLVLTDSIPELKRFFDSFGNIETLYPRLDSGFSLDNARRYDIDSDARLIEVVRFGYTQGGYSISVLNGNVGHGSPSRDPDAQLFIDGRTVDVYESIKEDGRTYLRIYLNTMDIKDNQTQINIIIPKDAADLPLEEILTFTTLNKLLNEVTPLNPKLDTTTEPATDPT